MSDTPLDRAVRTAALPLSPSHQDSHEYNNNRAPSASNTPNAPNRAPSPTANLTDTTSRNLRTAFDALDLEADNSISVDHIKQIIPVVFPDTPPTWDTLQHSIRTACELSDNDEPPDTITFPQFVNFFIALDEELIRTASASSKDLEQDNYDDPAPSQDPPPDQSNPQMSSNITPSKRHRKAPRKEDDPFDLFHFDMSNIDNVFSMLDPSGDNKITPTELHDTLNSLGFAISHDEATAMVDLASSNHNARFFNNQHFHSLVRNLRSTVSHIEQTHVADRRTDDKHLSRQHRVRHNLRKSNE